MHLTPDMVESAYELLRTTLPFRRWKLPHPDDLVFNVTGHRDQHAHFRTSSIGHREISVSQYHAKDLSKLLQDVAHEMVHLWQDVHGHRDLHGRHFKQQAEIVCRRHHWNLADF